MNFEKFKNISGIYQIKNIITNQIYIGSSKCLKIRFTNHLTDLLNKKHANQRLQNSFNKYGQDVFIFSLLLECSKEYNIKLEQIFLDQLLPYYNINKLAYSCLGTKRNAEHKKKLSISKSGIKNPQAKLTMLEVKNIRKSNLKGYQLAKIYNISTSQISMVKNYKSYINI